MIGERKARITTMFLNPNLFIIPHTEIQDIGIHNITYGSLTIKGVKTKSKNTRYSIYAYLWIGFRISS